MAQVICPFERLGGEGVGGGGGVIKLKFESQPFKLEI